MRVAEVPDGMSQQKRIVGPARGGDGFLIAGDCDVVAAGILFRMPEPTNGSRQLAIIASLTAQHHSFGELLANQPSSLLCLNWAGSQRGGSRTQLPGRVREIAAPNPEGTSSRVTHFRRERSEGACAGGGYSA